MRKTRTIFRHMLLPMCILILIQIGILSISFMHGGMFQRLEQNAKDILDQRVINRADYLENEMIFNWSDLEGLADKINASSKRLEQSGEIDLAALDESSANATPLLLEIMDELIAAMRGQHVTGIYVIFSDGDLDDGLEDKTGVYIRDSDPLSGYSSENGDLLLERAPIEVVENSHIATDSGWHPRFEFGKRQIAYYDFFYTTYQQAYRDGEGLSISDLGYWGKSFQLNDSNSEAITYTVPLISDDGRVYGVLGIDITLSYLSRLLPNSELLEHSAGSYLLGVTEDGGETVQTVFTRGTAYTPDNSEIQLTSDGEEWYIYGAKRTFYSSVSRLELYDTNTPYSAQQWVLLGIADTDNLFSFSDTMIRVFQIAVLLMLLTGILGSFLASYLIAAPIRRLSGEVESYDAGKQVTLGRTDIAEIDHLAGKMEILNRRVRDSAMKFSHIMKMASIEMAGFEYNDNNGEIFVSDNFFEVFRDFETVTDSITKEEFKKRLEEYKGYAVSRDVDTGGYLLKLPDGEKGSRYLNLRLLSNGAVHTGVVENVTDTVMEKKAIEYERDHDMLTGLLNRRAFRSRMYQLFENGEIVLKTAALLMVDLDNLKRVNDSYGHEKGDEYISRATECFAAGSPADTIIARISGDEFFLFFYGYEREADIRTVLGTISEKLMAAGIRLADGGRFPISVSGGVAWYPKDTTDLETLQQYADYTMYNAKRAGKGRILEFDKSRYEQDTFFDREKRELHQIIKENAVQFYFQPIVDSRTGNVFGYEALMRALTPNLKSPVSILKLAKEENCLGEIETLTWMHAVEAYAKHRKSGYLEKDCRLFINSISNQILPEHKCRELEARFSGYLKNIVLEVTEGEQVNEDYHIQKEQLMRRWGGAVAIDDYGSGYNGDLVLLFLAPRYIKLDINLVRGIHQNPDKCRIVENIVGYAHERGMKIIAEGVEEEEELWQVIRLDVDYIQGYALARPQLIPPHPDPKMIQRMKYFRQVENQEQSPQI